MRGRRIIVREDSPRERRSSAAKRRRTGIAAVSAAALVLILALLLQSNAETRRYERYRRLAAESYQNGQYDQALSELRKAEAIRSSEDLLMLMADCYEAQGNWDLALETLRKMDRSEIAVTERISALERRKLQQQEGEQRIVAGESFPADIGELDLNGRGLGNGALQEVQQLYALTSLSLANNRISDLSALASLGGLRFLDLSGNAIEELSALRGLENLRSLYLDGNPLTDLSPLYRLGNLNTLSLRGIALPREALRLLTEALPQCAILVDGEKENVTGIWLSGVYFDTRVTELELKGLGLRDIGCLGLCSQLKTLNLTDNAIGDLSPLMNLRELDTLKISGNQISDLRPLMGLPALRHLAAANNSLSETSAVGSIPTLLSLDLSDNPIRDFSGLRKLGKLQTLSLENTGLRDTDLPLLYGMNRLYRLELDRNEGLSAEAMNQLKSKMPQCSIDYGTLVYTVELGGREYRSDAVSLCVEGTELESLFGLEKFYRLETVQLGKNMIEDLSAFQNTHCRDTIRTLDLSFNRIRSVSPLTALSSLEVLDLRGNQIDSLKPLMQMSQLKKLKLGGNPLTPEQIDELRRALPGCEIEF